VQQVHSRTTLALALRVEATGSEKAAGTNAGGCPLCRSPAHWD